MASTVGSSCGSTDAVDVFSGVIGCFKLNYPVDVWDLWGGIRWLLCGKGSRKIYIQTSSCNVCAYQGSLLCVTELEECVGALLLLLLAV